jgi:uncharacterized delta-60 repeat protein
MDMMRSGLAIKMLALGCAIGATFGATAAVAAPQQAAKRSTAGRLDQSFATHGRLVVTVGAKTGERAEPWPIGEPVPQVAMASRPGGGVLAANGRKLFAFGSNGRPDQSFGQNGRIAIPSNGEAAFRLGGVAVDSQGRILLAGTGISLTVSSTPPPPAPPGYGFQGANGPAPQWALVYRYLPDGRLDPSFGEGGVAKTLFNQKPPTGPGPFDIPYEVPAVRVTGLAMTADDGIVVAGISAQHEAIGCKAGVPFASSSRSFIGRLDSTGALDQSFGSGGAVTEEAIESSRGPALDAAGNVTFGGGPGGPCGVLGPEIAPKIDRLLANGGFDPSFGEGGGVGSSIAIEALDSDGQGRLVVLGYVQNTAGEKSQRVWRLLPNGSADPSFGRGGTTSPLLPMRASLAEVATDGRGRVVLGGTAPSKGGAGTSFLLTRLSAAGKAEPKFGQGRWTKTSLVSFGKARASALSIDRRGRILLGGTVEAGNLNSGYGLGFARYLGGD